MPDLSSLPITKRPFKLQARRLGISEGVLLSSLKAYKKNGLIRRFGAILDHQKCGLKANALVVWKVKQKKLDSAGKLMAKIPEVSHCYSRRSYTFWPYNLYTMLHASTSADIWRVVREIAGKIKPDAYKVLFTLKEFKKTRSILR